MDTTQLAQFRFDDDALGVGAVNDALGNRDILIEVAMAGIDHH